jgi:indolepyruvate ferredoxin oxidoreductase beta subunit
VVNERVIAPLPVLIGDEAAPVGVRAALEYEGAAIIDAEAIACAAGSPRSANVVLLGALSVGLPFPVDAWCDVITARVPAKTVEGNLAAFHAGRTACEMGRGTGCAL